MPARFRTQPFATAPRQVLDAPVLLTAPSGYINYDACAREGAYVRMKLGPIADPGTVREIIVFDGEASIATFAGDGTASPTVALEGKLFCGQPLPPPEDYFGGDGPHVYSYAVTYSGAGVDTSGTTSAIVKATRPTGTHPQEPGHPDDMLQPLDIAIQTDANSEAVSALLTIKPWPRVEVGDVATAIIDGQAFEFPRVDRAGVVPPLTLTRTQLETIPSGDGIPCTYRIIDVARNATGYAPYVMVSIWTGAKTGLEKPRLRYKSGDEVTVAGASSLSPAGIDTDQESEPSYTLDAAPLALATVDLEKMANDGLSLVIPRYGGAGDLVGDQVYAHLAGTTSAGEPVSRVLDPVSWGNDEDNIPPSLDVRVDTAWIRGLSGGSLRIWYTTTSEQGDPSKIVRFLVGRLPVVAASAPVAPEAGEGGVLDPSMVHDYVILEIPGHAYLVAGSTVTVFANGVASNGDDVSVETELQVTEDHPVGSLLRAYLPMAELSKLMNTVCSVSYQIVPWSDDAPPLVQVPIQSDVLVLHIGKAGSPGNLPPPLVYDLSDEDVIDPLLPRVDIVAPPSGALLKDALVTFTLTADAGDTQTHTLALHKNFQTAEVTFDDYLAGRDGQEIKASYAVAPPAGGAALPSDIKTFYVGSMPSHFGPPVLPDAPGNALDLLDHPVSVSVSPAADAGLTAADTYTVTVSTATGTVLHTTAAQRGDSQPVAVPAWPFARCMGTTATVHYDVTRDGKPTKSTPLVITVHAMESGDPRLPRVKVDEGPEQSLDVSALSGDAHYRVAAWPGMGAGQRVWITGTEIEPKAAGAPGAAADDLLIATSRAVTAAEVTAGEITGMIDLAWLKRRADGVKIYLPLKVALDGGANEGKAFSLRTTFLTIIAVPPFQAPTLAEASNGELDIGKLAGGANGKTKPHASVKAGARYWAKVYIPDREDGVPITEWLVTDEAVTAAQATSGLTFTLPKETLAGTTLNSSFDIIVSVTLDGSSDISKATNYPVASFRLIRTSEWTLEENFDEITNPPTEIKPGQNMMLPPAPATAIMLVNFDSAGLVPEQTTIGIEAITYTPKEDFFKGNVLRIGAPQNEPQANIVTITFVQEWRKVRLAITSVDNPVTVTWKDGQGTAIGTPVAVPGGDPEEGYDVIGEAAAGSAGIKQVTLEAADVIRLDYFKFV